MTGDLIAVFVARTQERIRDGRLGPVVIDLADGGEWRISADCVECLRDPVEATK